MIVIIEIKPAAAAFAGLSRQGANMSNKDCK